MPLIEQSKYPGPPWYQFNGHFQTIVPVVLRLAPRLDYKRERLILSDGDFVDLDWMKRDSDRLVVLVHGLEGSAYSTYIRGLAGLLYEKGWDVLAWNCRSCSGEMNRALRMYHHGETDDINEVIKHAIGKKPYRKLALAGFSMGGSIILNYLAQKKQEVPAIFHKAVAVSVPLNLETCSAELEKPRNRIYKHRFFLSLRKKIRQKARQHPGALDYSKFSVLMSWLEFDNAFSAPMFGFKDAYELYHHSSSIHRLDQIEHRTLIINAWNDPFLPEDSFPKARLESHKDVFLEIPNDGGHVGFSMEKNTPGPNTGPLNTSVRTFSHWSSNFSQRKINYQV